MPFASPSSTDTVYFPPTTTTNEHIMEIHGAGGSQDPKDRKGSVDDYNVFDDAQTYYTDSRHKVNRATARTRTFSQVCHNVPPYASSKPQADPFFR